jgi:hypothetical protein
VTIDAYLVALERLLPRIARLRVLPEVREHLRDAATAQRASGLSPRDAEIAATWAFGAVEDLARRLGAELAVRESRLAGLLALATTVFFVFPLYVVPENTLPPAPWSEKPRDIALLQHVALACWIVACLLAAVAMLLAWTRWFRNTAPVLACATAALTGATAVTAAVAVRWFSLTPATPAWALAAPLALACVVACSAAALWARASSRRLAVPTR